MGKKKRGIVRRTFGSLFNVRAWLGWDQLKYSTGSLIGTIKKIFVQPKPRHHETFEQGIERLGFTEEDIAKCEKNFFHTAIICFCLSLILASYTIYLLLIGHGKSAFTCSSLTFLSLAYSYREHFWYTQVKQRKLGCTFKDWLAFNQMSFRNKRGKK